MSIRALITLILIAPILAQAAIFGNDDRRPLLSTSTEAIQGRSVAIAVLSTLIAPNKSNPDQLDLQVSPLSEMICRDEKFASNPSLSYACTGFLVAPDLLVTAGHCMSNAGEVRNESGMACEAYGWLFDYQQDMTGSVQTKGIAKDRYYKCKKIIFATKDEAFPFRDYALVQLDRPVKDRAPLRLATSSPVKGESVRMLGFPFGTPMKIASNAKVLIDDLNRQSQITNLDAFDGNSGSPVFNQRGEVAGILVGGTPYLSLITKQGESCQRYNRCNESGGNCWVPDDVFPSLKGFQGIGSEVQRITPVIELLLLKDSLLKFR